MGYLTSTAFVTVTLDMEQGTIQDVKDWIAEVERLHFPESIKLDDCLLSVTVMSDVVDTTFGESELGVEGYDILVGLPR